MLLLKVSRLVSWLMWGLAKRSSTRGGWHNQRSKTKKVGVTRISPISSKVHMFYLAVTSDQLQQIRGKARTQIPEDATQGLEDWEVEFIRTGIPPREWAGLSTEDLKILQKICFHFALHL